MGMALALRRFSMDELERMADTPMGTRRARRLNTTGRSRAGKR